MCLKEDVTLRLMSLNYEVAPMDDWALEFCIRKTNTHIKNFCNIQKIPEELYEVQIDMVCGEFLLFKNAIGGAVPEDAAAQVKAVAEGDTRFEMETGGSLEQRLTKLVNYYLTGRNSELVSFRRLRW